MLVPNISSWIDDLSELISCLAMSFDEGNGDGEIIDVASNTLDTARGISRFGESVANLFADRFVGREKDMFAPCDIVGVDK